MRRALLSAGSAALLIVAAAGCGATADDSVGVNPIVTLAPSLPVTSTLINPSAVPAGAPTHLTVPTLGLDKSIRTLPAESCPTIDPPTLDDPYWLQCRSAPGTHSDGTTFIVGHAVAHGHGVFNDLGRLTVGAPIILTTVRGELTYRVSSLTAYRRDGEIQRARQLRERVPGRLLLVTCRLGPAGQLTDDNLVVQADLVSAVAVHG